MSKRLKAIFDFYLYSNLHIAFCAVAMMLVTNSILHLGFSLSLFLITFFGTLSLYCFQRLSSVLINDGKEFPGARNKWNFRSKNFLAAVIVISIAPILYGFFQLNNYSRLVLLVAGLISSVYSIPVFKFKGKSFSLRDFPLTKIFLIAFVWTLVTVVIPVMETVKWFRTREIEFVYATGYWALVVFILIFAITIPFDVRDMKTDSPSIRTLPMVIGEKKAVRLSQFLLVISCIVLFVGSEHTAHISFIAFLYYSVWAALSIWILHDCSREKGEYYFSFTIDGLMIFLLGIIEFAKTLGYKN